MQILLDTDRLVLRRFTSLDTEKLVDLDSDPEVMRFLTGDVPTPRKVIDLDILPRFLRSYDRPRGCGFWAAIEMSSGDFLGWSGTRRPPRHRRIVSHAGRSTGRSAAAPHDQCPDQDEDEAHKHQAARQPGSKL